MNTDEKLQKALDALALSAAQLNESAIHLRCLFADANRKDQGATPGFDQDPPARANCQKLPPKYTGPVQPSEVQSVLASMGVPVNDQVWFHAVRQELELRYRERGLL